MIKLLIVNPFIPDYRLPIFNLLGKSFDLTILHSGKVRAEENNSFRQLIYPLQNFGPFQWHKVNLHKLFKDYDVIISDGNIRYLDRNFLICNPFRKYKWINWGIGVSASYKNKFDQNTKFDFIRHFIFKFADAQLFYSSYPIQKYLRSGFDKNSLFVANNTTQVMFNDNLKYDKHKLLFVGSLYKEKRIFDLLESYILYFNSVVNPLPLTIIGDGEEKLDILKWIQENNLNSHIEVLGSIFNQKLLEKHFRESFACISPGQAGLSVLTSLGYGVPFVTKNDAITGGEIFNIINGYNGVLYNRNHELQSILIDIHNNKDKYFKMSFNSRQYYLEFRTIDVMVQGFLESIEFVLKKNDRF